MADNIELNSGSGGATLRTDDDGTAHWQYVKLAYGADNTQTIVSTSNPLPVDIRAENASLTVDNAGTFAVQATQAGTWTVQLGATDNAVLDQIDSNTDFGAVTGGGTETGALRVTIANNSTGVVSVDDNGSSLTVDGTVTANAGTNLNTSALALESGGNLATIAGAVSGSEMQVDIVSGTVDLGATDNAVLDSIEANTSGSTSHYRNIDANAEAAIKGSAGTLKWLHAMNMTAAVAYLHLYDATTASVTPGTTTPDFTFPLATQGDTNGAGFVLPAPIEFANAITLVVTTTTDGSTGDPGTNGVFVNAGYT